jgi:hypothetical protein
MTTSTRAILTQTTLQIDVLSVLSHPLNQEIHHSSCIVVEQEDKHKKTGTRMSRFIRNQGITLLPLLLRR